MGTLVKSEIRKMLLKPSIIITWIVLLLFSKILIRPDTASEVWADVFNKIYGIVPLIGLITFMIISVLALIHIFIRNNIIFVGIYALVLFVINMILWKISFKVSFEDIEKYS